MQYDTITKLQEILNSINEDEQDIYNQNLHKLKESVDQKLLNRSDLTILIGANNIEIMTTNHLNHANFISSIIVIKSAKTLFDTIIWVYRTYIARGFTHRYFYYELKAWFDSIEELELEIPNIKRLYIFLIGKHNIFISLSTIQSNLVVDEKFANILNQFIEAILAPDINRAIEISNKYINNIDEVKIFWQGVILPALYEVGRQWSENIITVGQEHMATSVCQRVMAVHYPKVLEYVDYDSKSVLVACSPHELHEVGARMISDFLEIEGFNSFFLGANTPNESIINIIKVEFPIAIAISTTLVGNIIELKKLIEQIREDTDTKDIKIILGGQSFLIDPSLLEGLDYDFYSKNPSEVITYLKALG